MIKFQGQKVAANKELLLLQKRLGGQVGILSSYGEKTEALKLADGVYAVAKKVSQTMKVMATMEGQDIHPVVTSTDAVFFAERYKAFRGAIA